MKSTLRLILCCFLSLGMLLLSIPVSAQAASGGVQRKNHTPRGDLTSPVQVESVWDSAEKKGVLELSLSMSYNMPTTEASIRSRNSSISASSAADAPNTIGNDVVAVRNYTVHDVYRGKFTINGKKATKPQGNDRSTWVTDLIGPTLRMSQGDEIIIHLSNDLPNDRGTHYPNEKLSCIQNSPVSDATCNMANFHTHGFHDTPKVTRKDDSINIPGRESSKTVDDSSKIFVVDNPSTNFLDYWVGDDVIDSLLPGGNQFDIKVTIPYNHPAGTFWYHPHQHGATAIHLASGLEGVLIVDDLPPGTPECTEKILEARCTLNEPGTPNEPTLDTLLENLNERILAFQQILYEPSISLDIYDEDSNITDATLDCDDDTPCEVFWTNKAILASNVKTPSKLKTDSKDDPRELANQGAADASTGKTFTGYTLVNGQVYPTIKVAPKETERWRLVDAMVQEAISLQIVKLSDEGVTNLDSLFDDLIVSNRKPFDSKNPVIGTKPNPNKGEPKTINTDSLTWLANAAYFDTKTIEKTVYVNKHQSGSPWSSNTPTEVNIKEPYTVPLNLIAYDGITTGRIDQSTCLSSITGKTKTNSSPPVTATKTNPTPPPPVTVDENGVLQNCLTMGPGNRRDALVRFEEEGTYLLLKGPNAIYMNNQDVGESLAEDVLAVIDVNAEYAKNTTSPSSELFAKVSSTAKTELCNYAKRQLYSPISPLALDVEAKQGKDSSKQQGYLSTTSNDDSCTYVSPKTSNPKKQGDHTAFEFLETDIDYNATFLFFPSSGGPSPSDPTQGPRLNNGMTYGMSVQTLANTFNKKKNKKVTGRKTASQVKIDNESFTEDLNPIILTENQIGGWTLENFNSQKGPASAHPFHIHQNPFFLTEIETCDTQVTGTPGDYSKTYSNCTSETINRWQDTILTQPNQKVHFLYQPLKYDGPYVFHCHFVEHEDQGMMRWVTVCPPDKDDPTKPDATCASDTTYGLLPDFVREDL